MLCFVDRMGYRGRGLTYALGRAVVDFGRERGARAIEAYPMITQPGKEITWGEVHVGARQVFEDAGFEEVSHPTVRRVVMRIDFEQRGAARCSVMPPGAGAVPTVPMAGAGPSGAAREAPPASAASRERR